MTTTLRINVTQDDIDRAVQANSFKCVVAVAVERELHKRHAKRVSVDIQTIAFTDDEGRWTYLTPARVQRYVIAFDAGLPLEPFTFMLHNRNRVSVRKQTKTPAGIARSESAANERRAIKQLDAVRANADASPEELAAAEAKLEQRRVERSLVRLDTLGQPSTTPRAPGAPTRRAAPNAWGSGRREYGVRFLQVSKDAEFLERLGMKAPEAQ